MSTREKPPLRVLVIDDSAYNRRAVAGFLESTPGIEVIGKARDGQDGLQIAINEKPDVITLDLEMPRMDGFSFLRLLMARQPTPVIVISSHAKPDNVFRALELGAVDFVAKPTARISPEIHSIRDEVVRKVLLARNLERRALRPVAPLPVERALETGSYAAVEPEAGLEVPEAEPRRDVETRRLVVIAASTGGPAALTRILTSLPGDIEAGIVVVQHMPPRFTTTFAERLNRQANLQVREVTRTEILHNGSVWIAPGDRNVEVLPLAGGSLAVRAVAPDPGDRYVPSADHLFVSAAASACREVLAMVLTGMGDDGRLGVEAVADAGGMVVAESEETAVVAGMPMAAIRTGHVARVEPLGRMMDVIRAFSRG
jgi:two-component system chemotaxis response regulator CheB